MTTTQTQRRHSAYYIKATPAFRGVMWTFLALSFAMLTAVAFFKYQTGFDHPQNLVPDYFKVGTLDLPKGPILIYFILDIVWSALLILLLLAICKGYRTKAYVLYQEYCEVHFSFQQLRQLLPKLLLVIALAAYLADTVENIIFPIALLQENPSLLGIGMTVKSIKMVLYASLFVAFFYYFFYHVVLEFKDQILKFLSSSALSLIIILVVSMLLTQMGQGIALLADLTDRPLQILFVYYFLNLLALIISHYPVYLQDSKTYDEHFLWQEGKYGLLYLITDAKSRHKVKFPIYNILRRSLGVVLLIAWFYVLFFSLQNFLNYSLSAVNITVLIAMIALGYYWFLEKQKFKWKTEGRREFSQLHIDRIGRSLTISLYVFLGFLVISMVVSYFMGWSLATVLTLIATTIANLVYFGLFRVNRSLLYNIPKERGLKRLLTAPQITSLSDNEKYLQFMALPGYFLFVILLVVNIFLSWQSYINPLLILLAYLVVYYGIIISIIKRIRYYMYLKERDEMERTRSSIFWMQLAPFMFIILLPVLFLVSPSFNRLHELTPVPSTETLLSTDTYMDNDQRDTILLVASDGGGVRAAFWNLLIMHQLDSLTNQRFFQHTLSMSGASGGSLGQGLYTALKIKHKTDGVIPKSEILAIGENNFLSSDLTYLVGRDFVLGKIPGLGHRFKDRADAMIYNYTNLMYGPEEGKKIRSISFFDYWQEGWKAYSEFPVLIVNTAQAESSQRGVASPLGPTPGIFSAAVDILQYPQADTTLAYFDALFTTNRFPIFSPAALIPGKGHFIDGGYFDNSGLTSSIDMLQMVRQYYATADSSKTAPVVYVLSIHNDSYWYSIQFLEQLGVPMDNVQIAGQGQLTSILSGVSGSSIKGIPSFWRQELDELERLGYIEESYEVYLPFLLSIDDIWEALNGKLDDYWEARLIKAIKDHNNKLIRHMQTKDLNRFELINPPLGRLMSKPVVRYMDGAIHYPQVRNELHKVSELLKKEN